MTQFGRHTLFIITVWWHLFHHASEVQHKVSTTQRYFSFHKSPIAQNGGISLTKFSALKTRRVISFNGETRCRRPIYSIMLVCKTRRRSGCENTKKIVIHIKTILDKWSIEIRKRVKPLENILLFCVDIS